MHSAFKKMLLISTISVLTVAGGPVATSVLALGPSHPLAATALADGGSISSFEAGPNGGYDTGSGSGNEAGTGGAGSDTGTGGAGSDTGTGGAGSDTGTGGAGSDTGTGGAGSDTGTGGAGSETGSGTGGAD